MNHADYLNSFFDKFGRLPLDEPTPQEMAIADAVGLSVRSWAFSKYRDTPAIVEAPEALVIEDPTPPEVASLSIGTISRKPRKKRAATWQRLSQARQYKDKLKKKPCTIEGCKEGQRAGKMCNKHYKQFKKGTLIVPLESQPKVNPQPTLKPILGA